MRQAMVSKSLLRPVAAGQWGKRQTFSQLRVARITSRFPFRALAAAAPQMPQTVSGCYVYPGEGQIRGICHFLGGAFACCAPQAFYPLMIQTLAEAGYTVLVTPHALTFKHGECVEELHGRFWTALEDLRNSHLNDSVPINVPVHGIGHSAGALFHALICSTCDGPQPTSNILISFNSREISAAVPVPGLVDGLQTAFQALPETILTPPNRIGRAFLRQYLNIAPPGGLKDLALSSVDPLFDQLDSLFQELREGPIDFVPTPQQAKEIIREKYDVASTLIMSFPGDPFDDTPVLVDLLCRGASNGDVKDVLVEGNHLTPLGGDIEWLQSSNGLVNRDVVGEVQQLLQKDIYGLLDKIVSWLNSHSMETMQVAAVETGLRDEVGGTENGAERYVTMGIDG